MTTIAFKDGVIAYDSRTTQGDNTILTDAANKRHSVSGHEFFISGSVPDERQFISDYLSGEKTRVHEINAFVWDGKELFHCGCNAEGIWKSPVDCCRAIGSGSDHALTAMDMGATAAEAVKIAMKRDPFTGGKIKTFRIPKQTN